MEVECLKNRLGNGRGMMGGKDCKKARSVEIPFRILHLIAISSRSRRMHKDFSSDASSIERFESPFRHNRHSVSHSLLPHCIVTSAAAALKKRKNPGFVIPLSKNVSALKKWLIKPAKLVKKDKMPL